MVEVPDELWESFHAAVTMTSRELRDWLGTQANLGDHPGPEGRVAPLGARVAEILAKRRTDLTADDAEVMRRVLEVVAEETDGVPEDEVAADERRRRRLMNVGHDPLAAQRER
jgi:hypothetical protein